MKVSNHESDASTGKPIPNLEMPAYYVFLVVASSALIALVILIVSITLDDEAVRIRTIITETIDRTTKMVVESDTAHVVDPAEYERLLTQLREQNQFLTSMLGTIATFGTVVAAFIALFVWRIQKKYELFDEGHGKAVKLHADITTACEDANSRTGELIAISQELKAIEATLENYVDRMEAAIDVFYGGELMPEDLEEGLYDPDIEPDDIVDIANAGRPTEDQMRSVVASHDSIDDDDADDSPVDTPSMGDVR